jgi:hypothetical protein
MLITSKNHSPWGRSSRDGVGFIGQRRDEMVAASRSIGRWMSLMALVDGGWEMSTSTNPNSRLEWIEFPRRWAFGPGIPEAAPGRELLSQLITDRVHSKDPIDTTHQGRYVPIYRAQKLGRALVHFYSLFLDLSVMNGEESRETSDCRRVNTEEPSSAT